MTALRIGIGALLALSALSCSGCSKPAAAAQPTLVFAAASLAAPFQAMAAECERQNPGTRFDLHFAGTPQLVMQVREGAAADVFASADLANMTKLVAAGHTAAPPTILARNRLTIVTTKGNPKGIQTLADLGRKEVRVALCGPEVPAGRYAREALAKASVSVQSVSDEPSVTAVVSKVQLGELDAGIVYVTDVAGGDAQIAAVLIPDEHNVVATYPIAVLTVGRNRAAGAAFVTLVLSAEGQRILRSFGFQDP